MSIKIGRFGRFDHLAPFKRAGKTGKIWKKSIAAAWLVAQLQVTWTKETSLTPATWQIDSQESQKGINESDHNLLSISVAPCFHNKTIGIIINCIHWATMGHETIKPLVRGCTGVSPWRISFSTWNDCRNKLVQPCVTCNPPNNPRTSLSRRRLKNIFTHLTRRILGVEVSIS